MISFKTEETYGWLVLVQLSDYTNRPFKPLVDRNAQHILSCFTVFAASNPIASNMYTVHPIFVRVSFWLFTSTDWLALVHDGCNSFSELYLELT